MRTVFLARHAKSSWKNTSLSDKDRPLKKRGVKDLGLLKPVLIEHAQKPVHIFSSDAKRAAKTAKILAGFYDLRKDHLTYTDELYASSYRGIIDFIKNTDDDLHSIMIVGHNPDLSETASLLWEEPSGVLMPTSAVICFSFELDRWKHLAENSGHMEFHEYPKKYK